MEIFCYPPSLDHLPFFGDNFTLGVSKTLSVSDTSRMSGPAAIFYISVGMLVHCTVHLAANSLALVSGNCTRSCRKSWKSSAITCWSQPQNWHPSKSGNCKVCALGENLFFCRTTMESIKTEKSLRQGEYANWNSCPHLRWRCEGCVVASSWVG